MAEYSGLIARLCLSAVFLWSGITKLLDPQGAKAEVAELGLPYPALFATLTIVCQLGGGALVLLGFWTRLGAAILLAFTVIATLLAHRPTHAAGGSPAQQITTSLEHLAIVGGFALLAAYGAGPMSLDRILS